MHDTITSRSSPRREPTEVLSEVLSLLPERFPEVGPTPDEFTALLRERGAGASASSGFTAPCTSPPSVRRARRATTP